MKSKLFILNILVLLFISNVEAQEENNPFMYSMENINITVLPERQQEVNNTGILIGATDDMLKACLPENTYITAINAFLIETDSKSILVDAGLGQRLFNNLESCGKSPEDIDIILLTHMHGDHIGGLLQDGKRSFPNAILYISQLEYDYWMNDQAMNSLPENNRGGFLQARQVIRAYKDNLHLFAPGELGGKEHEILPGIRSVAAYGHTPGHTAYLLEAYDDRFLIWGDVAHVMPVQMSYPQVAVTYDTDPVKAVESRRRLLQYILENDVEVAGMHIEYPGMAKIRSNRTGGYNYILTCTCEGALR